jgi:hypothetical protein
MSIIENYRKAAMSLFGTTRSEATKAIVEPENDPGKWAPDALAVIYLEFDGPLSEALDYWGDGFENCIRLGEKAEYGYIEYINAAVAAVYE